jgi:hypothetical protein
MTDGQSASLSWSKAPIWGLRPDFYYCQTIAGLLMWGALSDQRMGLSFTIAAGPRQRSLYRVQSRWTCEHILLSQVRDFPFRRPLRLAGIRWKYSTPPPHGISNIPAYDITSVWLFLSDRNKRSRLLKLLHVYSTEVNQFTKCTFLFPHIISNLLKMILTSFFVVNHFATVALMNHKYFFNRFPHAELF